MHDFQTICFELTGKWFTVGKIRKLQRRHTGYYCDIVTPPDFRCEGLDEKELENAFRKRWITKQLYNKAKREPEELVNAVKQGTPYTTSNA